MSKLVVYKKSADVEVDGDSMVKRKIGWDNGLILIGKGVVKGKARFTVQVLKGRKTTIGVCLSDVNINSYVNKTSSGWGYYQSSGKYGHNGPAKKRGGEPYKNEPGTIVTTELDVDSGTLRFYKNGVDQGIAYDDLPKNKRYYFAISFYEPQDGAVFLKSEYGSVLNPDLVSNNRPPAFDEISQVPRPPPRLAVVKSKEEPFTSSSSSSSKPSFPVYYKHEHVLINKHVVRKSKDGWDNGLVLIGDPVREGKIRWSFKVIRGRKSTVGVCLSNVDRLGYVNKTEKGWGFYAGGRRGTGGPAKMKFGRAFKNPGDVLVMEMDCDLGILRYELNGEDLGIAFSNLPKGAEYVAALSLYKENDAMEVSRGMEEEEMKQQQQRRSSSFSSLHALTPPRPPPIIVEKNQKGIEGSEGEEVNWIYKKASRINVNYVKRVVKKTEHGWNNGLILLGKPVRSKRDGIARWSVRLDRTRKATIGICQTDVDMTGYVNRSAKGWVRSFFLSFSTLEHKVRERCSLSLFHTHTHTHTLSGSIDRDCTRAQEK